MRTLLLYLQFYFIIVIYWVVGRECGRVSERSGGERGGYTIAIPKSRGDAERTCHGPYVW